jgi:hypothetical protein
MLAAHHEARGGTHVRAIQKTQSLLVYVEELEFMEAALLADPENADLALAVAEMIEAWEGVFRAERLARRNIVRADAVVSVRNLVLDGVTRAFGAYALAEAGGDRRSVAFRRFFPTAVNAFVRGALRKQCEQTLNVLVPHIEALGAEGRLAPFAARLRDAAQSALEAVDARTKVKADRQRSAIDVEEWKEGVNRLRTTLYAELLKRAADRGLPARDYADAYFRAQEKGGSVAIEPEPIVTPPA